MKFEILFNDSNYNNDEFLIEKLGAFYVPTGSDKYPPFEILQIEVEDFKKLEEITKIIDKEFNTYSSMIISFDPATLYIDFN
jgi:hypothetical protein